MSVSFLPVATGFWVVGTSQKGYALFLHTQLSVIPHVHVQSPKGEAKYWLEPDMALAKNKGFSERDLRIIETIIKEHEDEIRSAWHKHFKA